MTDPAQTPIVDAPVAAKITTARVGSLYVTDLDEGITESSLYGFFGSSSVGPTAVASIRVCKDSQNNTKSLGYAYANFHKSEDAQKAMDELNNTPILPGGPPCRITWSIRDPSLRKSGVGNVFIKNLDKEIDNEALFDAFSSYGDILSCKVSVANGVSNGFGFVHFAKLEDSEKAIAALHGKCFNGKQVYVAPFIPRSKRPKADAAHYTNIYLKHISPDVTSEQFDLIVAKLTADIGKITSPKLMVENVEKDGKVEEKSRRFGFVNFENHEVAVAALERFKDDAKVRELAPEFIAPEKNLYASVAIPKSQRFGGDQKLQNLNLYVKNLPESMTDERLKDLFKEFGPIGSVVVMRNAENISRGFGFVCFETPEAATAAINKMHSSKFDGKPLYVALAQSREYRTRQLAISHQSRAMNQRLPYGYNGGMVFPQHPGMRGYPPNNRVYRPQQQQFPMPNRPQSEAEMKAMRDKCAHILFEILIKETEYDDLLCKKTVGNLLNQYPRPSQAIDILNEFIHNPEKRKIQIEKMREELTAAK